MIVTRRRDAQKSPRYVVAALNHNAFLDWCRQHEIKPASVKYIADNKDLYGWHDHHVVLLRNYHRHPVFRDGDAAAVRLLSDSLVTYYEWDVPVVEKGRIVGWQ